MLFLEKLLIPNFKNKIILIISLPEKIFLLIVKKIAKKYPNILVNLIPKKIKNKLKKDAKYRYNMNKWVLHIINESEAIIFNNLTDREKSERVKKEWTVGKGLYWYERQAMKFSIDDVNKKRIEFINFLDSFINNYDVNLICEIGTGDGRFLNYLKNKYPEIEYFIGIDLIKELMEKNNKKYSTNNKKQIKFLTGEISGKYEEILNTNNNQNVLFLATRTFTCFTQSELEELFSRISDSKKGVAIGFFEQNDIDLKKEKLSRSRDQENRFSHNYIYLLEKYNLQIEKKEIFYNSRILNDYGILIFAINNHFKSDN